MAPKRERKKGFFQGLNFAARLNEVAFMAMVQKEIDSGEYKKEYETVREFVKEELGISYDSFRARSEAIRLVGPEITGTLVELGFHLRDVKMLDHFMSEEQKASLKKGVLEVGDRKIPINEEHAEDIRIVVANLKETADLARKSEKSLAKKLDGIDGEYKKSEKSLLKKVMDLEAIIKPDTPEKLEDAFLALDKMLEDFDTALRVLVWKSDWVKDDPACQAKIEGLQTRAEKRFESLRQDWDAFVNQ